MVFIIIIFFNWYINSGLFNEQNVQTFFFINVFAVTFEKFDVSLVNESIHLNDSFLALFLKLSYLRLLNLVSGKVLCSFIHSFKLFHNFTVLLYFWTN